MRRAVAALMWASLIGRLFLPLLASWLGSTAASSAWRLCWSICSPVSGARCCRYLAEFGVAADGHAGMRTALLYLANIFGSAAGSILTGFVLIDHLGIVGIGGGAGGGESRCAAALIGVLPSPRTQKMLQASTGRGACRAGGGRDPVLVGERT